MADTDQPATAALSDQDLEYVRIDARETLEAEQYLTLDPVDVLAVLDQLDAARAEAERQRALGEVDARVAIAAAGFYYEYMAGTRYAAQGWFGFELEPLREALVARAAALAALAAENPVVNWSSRVSDGTASEDGARGR